MMKMKHILFIILIMSIFAVSCQGRRVRPTSPFNNDELLEDGSSTGDVIIPGSGSVDVTPDEGNNGTSDSGSVDNRPIKVQYSENIFLLFNKKDSNIMPLEVNDSFHGTKLFIPFNKKPRKLQNPTFKVEYKTVKGSFVANDYITVSDTFKNVKVGSVVLVDGHLEVNINQNIKNVVKDNDRVEFKVTITSDNYNDIVATGYINFSVR